MATRSLITSSMMTNFCESKHVWIATGVVAYVEKLPFFPFFFEVVGITYSGYFVYRYLLFKPDREELSDKIDEYKGKIGL